MNSKHVAWTSYAALVISVVTAGFLILRQPTPAPALSGAAQPKFNVTNKITAAVLTAPPTSSFDPSTRKPNGHAVDVMTAIGRNAKLQVDYVPTDWATMGAALTSGKADVVIGPVFMTEGRAREFAFTDPLYSYAIVPVVKKNSPLNTMNDLKKAGLRVAVGRGGFDAEFVSRNMPDAKVAVFPPDDPNLSMLEVKADRADVALVDFSTAQKFMADNPEVEIRLAETPISLQYASFMVRRNDEALRSLLNVGLLNLDVSGELSTIDARYAKQRSWYGRVSNKPTMIR